VGIVANASEGGGELFDTSEDQRCGVGTQEFLEVFLDLA